VGGRVRRSTGPLRGRRPNKAVVPIEILKSRDNSVRTQMIHVELEVVEVLDGNIMERDGVVADRLDALEYCNNTTCNYRLSDSECLIHFIVHIIMKSHACRVD